MTNNNNSTILNKINWLHIRAIGQLISAAVVISLVYLAYKVKQNTIQIDNLK